MGSQISTSVVNKTTKQVEPKKVIVSFLDPQLPKSKQIRQKEDTKVKFAKFTGRFFFHEDPYINYDKLKELLKNKIGQTKIEKIFIQPCTSKETVDYIKETYKNTGIEIC